MPDYLPDRFRLVPLDDECFTAGDDGDGEMCQNGAYAVIMLHLEGTGEVSVNLCIQHLKSFAGDLFESAHAEHGALESEASRMIEHINEQMRATQRGDEQ